MAVTEVAAGDENAVSTISKSLEHEQCIETTGTHDPDDPDIRRILDTAATGKVSAGI
jgi:predicted Ser/Thr protein kinase